MYVISEKSNDTSWYINDTQISNSIFEDEEFKYRIEDVENFTEELMGWIHECNDWRRTGDSNNASNKILMKQDLKYLMNTDDEFMLSNIETNEYILESDNEDTFNKLCEELIELSKGANNV